MKDKFKSYSLFLISLILGSCNAGPDYVRPKVEMPPVYKEAPPQGWKVATPQDTQDRGHWWKQFQDPLLADLVEQATQANQSIAVAEAQYRQALALVDQAISGFFPAIGLTLGDTKSRAQNVKSTNIASSSSSQPYNTASLGLQASWELDLWGNVRRTVEADEAAAQASAAQLAAIRLSIQATVAQTYFQLRTLDEVQAVLNESVAAYEKFLKLTKNQYKAGTASQLTILQAEAQLEAIKVQAIDNGIARAQYEHALAVLINKPPAQFSIAHSSYRFVPPAIPVEVPSTLLERRPDIANAERLMAQANAEIGVATSAFFPTLKLSGLRSHDNQSFARLLSAPVISWSLGAQLGLALFDGGARAAAVAAADAAYQATVATYRQTVLAAFQDVEDNLSTLRILDRESRAQQRAVDVAQKKFTFTQNQYRAGVASSLDVLNAIFNVYVAKRNAISIFGRQMVGSVGLIKALG